MRYVFGFLGAFALSLMLSLGCGEGGKVFPCTEQGIRDAIAESGGPHTFECDGPTTVVTAAQIEIDNDVILDGEGSLAVDGNERHRVFRVAAGVTAELRGLTINRGRVAQEFVGGGIYISSGGIYKDGTLTLTNSTVSGNSARSGGGIFSRGRLTLTNSTVSGNTASHIGGGIANDSRRLTLTNSTVSGNTADDYGGGIANFNDGTVTLINSTVSGNSARFGGGIDTVGKVTLTNTLVVNNDCSGYMPSASGGGNIESPGSTCRLQQETDQVNVPAELLNLGPLQDNDGPTETHALLPGSVAIDQIPAEDCEVEADQRGESRPETGGDACDVGAFERQPDDLEP